MANPLTVHRPLRDDGIASPTSLARDLLDLAKPRITALVVMTTGAGLALAPQSLRPLPALLFLAGTALLVAAANTLNCWLEIDTDALMSRTRNRPLPAGRLRPTTALTSGVVLAAIALALLWGSTNALTTGLGLLALVSYVAIYTPLKRRSPWALVVGAVPGALPPLMGWTAATAEINTPGLVLFGLLFFWQLPHFIAIALHFQEDYARGGLAVLPIAHGERTARWHLFGSSVALLVFSAMAKPLGVAGLAYTITALSLGAGFVALALVGVRDGSDSAWSRRAFLYSLVYLPVVLGALLIDAA
jgi:protoheme IX farnesyltransferase